jgi:hypothetical protein
VREVKGVARRPSVFVRPLSMDDGRRLQRITQTAKNPGPAAPRDRGPDVRRIGKLAARFPGAGIE